MTALTVLVPLSIVMGIVGLLAFLWSLRARQYEDMDGAAERVLLDKDDEPMPEQPDKTRAKEADE